MKRINTEHLLTLGMALMNDKRSMERRVRGVFARKRSTKGALVLSLVLALALGVAAFTTACQPGQATASDSNAQIASGGDAVASGGNATASADLAVDDGFTKAEAMKNLAQELERSRELIVPHQESIVYTERGTWEIQQNPNDSDRLSAAEAFLKIANAIFETSYTADELNATYYIDKTGFRADVWRFDSKDDVLSGALEAKTLAFLSADCLNEPADALHASSTGKGDFDASAAAERVAKILGGSAGSMDLRGGYSRQSATNGWMLKRDVLFPLGDGRYCAVSAFGDENLTPTTVCVYPDENCGEEGAFWRADLEWTEGVTTRLHPEDFRKGEPGPDDMKVEEAYDFFYTLFDVAGSINHAANEKPKEPNATFYVDYSGARENYWHIEGTDVIFDLSSKTGRLISLTANGTLGIDLELCDIAYEDMGEKEYEDATRKLFVALFGEDAVKEIQENAVYDYHYCTMDPIMADGTQYEIMYEDGMIVEVASFYQIDPNTWSSVPEWLQEYAKVDEATGEITIPGFENGSKKIVPTWLADWVYVNNETGEVFAMEW